MDETHSQPAKRLKLRRRTVERAGPPCEVQPSDVSLTETLDRVLARGIVAQAEVVLAVADIPLVYVGLQALVSSVETAREVMPQRCSSQAVDEFGREISHVQVPATKSGSVHT